MKLSRNAMERIAGLLIVLAAVVLVVIGVFRSHKVYDPATEQFGIVAFTRESDKDLVVDATFAGVRREGDRLYTTYDRSQPRGKQACPT
ncbi:MAG: hypothetical protein IT364_21875 [Candidatus Hydrogenedentes bacterium]|nr:hypothetical protein [Candidatus Hydrogenedentota bacterium]